MAIYGGRRRRTGRRIVALVAAAAALVVLVLVWAAGRAPQPARPSRPDPVQALVGTLEIIPISYGGAVRDGALVEGQEAQYRGAQDAVRRAERLFREAQETIAARDPNAARLVRDALAQLAEAVEGREPPAVVEALAGQAREALAGLGAGGSAGARQE